MTKSVRIASCGNAHQIRRIALIAMSLNKILNIFNQSLAISSQLAIIDTSTTQQELNMNMDTLAKQSIEAAMVITGTDGKDQETQNIAFKLACAAMAEEAAK